MSGEKPISAAKTHPSSVIATAQEVLPKFGVAFVVDDDETTWTITRDMQGPGLDALRTGQRVRLMIDHHQAFSVVRAYQPQS